MLVLMGVHFWRIRKDGGLSRPEKVEGDQGTASKWYSWPVVMWTELAILVGVVMALLFAALVANAPLLEQASPAFPENPAKAPWYFLGIQELVSYSAFAGGLVVPVLFLVFLFSIPYVDRENRFVGQWFSGERGRRLVLVTAVSTLGFVLVQLAIQVLFGGLRNWVSGVSQWFIILFNPATVTSLFFIAGAVITKRKTASSRMAALFLFTASLVALVVFTLVGIYFRGPNWEFFWSASQWPVQ
jgi:quinol-cytochrome oxidoreductase complex cytochrome b subunit